MDFRGRSWIVSAALLCVLLLSGSLGAQTLFTGKALKNLSFASVTAADEPYPAGHPRHPDPRCRTLTHTIQDLYCNELQSADPPPTLPPLRAAKRPRISSPLFAPGRPLSSRLGNAPSTSLGEITGAKETPVYVPNPAIPEPFVFSCPAQYQDKLKSAHAMAYRYLYYLYTMIDFVYDMKAKSPSAAFCLWNEGEYPMLKMEQDDQSMQLGYPYPEYFFGDYHEGRLEVIRSHIWSILHHAFETSPPHVYCESMATGKAGEKIKEHIEDGGNCNHSSSDPRYISFCDSVPSEWLTVAIARLLIHEASHLEPLGLTHGQEGGPYYGPLASHALADIEPILAFTNPDNFAYQALCLGMAVDNGDFTWGDTCPLPIPGGGGVPSEPCVWEWDVNRNTTTCVAVPEGKIPDRPKGPGRSLSH